MYYRESLTVYEDLKWNIVQDLEAVWLNITVCSQSTLLGCLCHPPKSTTFFNCMYDLLDRILIKRKNIILLGDFNSNLLCDIYLTYLGFPTSM